MSGLDLSNLGLSTIDFSNLAGQSGAVRHGHRPVSWTSATSQDIPELATIGFPTIIQSAPADGAVKDRAGDT